MYESATEVESSSPESEKKQLILVEKKSTLKDMFYSISYSLSWNVSIFYIKLCKLSYVI